MGPQGPILLICRGAPLEVDVSAPFAVALTNDGPKHR